MPPIDAAYRNVTTGGFKGSHSTHNPPSVAPQAVCEKCHNGSSSYTTAHMNDFVNMTSNINDSPHPSRATYNKPRFFNQTSNPVMQTCSNVNCHFETTTPAWSSASYSSPDNCNGCHGAPPSDGSHPATSGSGKKHGDYYTTTSTSCSRCHPDHTSDTAPFAHATSAGRQLFVTFTTAPNDGFGRYTGNVNYPNYLPSQSPPRNGVCRNTYCHSPGNKATAFDNPNATATWGGSLNCTGCHKSNSASGDPMATGNHGKHISGGYSAYKCVKCHAATTSASLTITNLGNHVNGLVNVAFDSSTTAVNGTYKGSASPMTKAAGSTTGACANVYCHSTVQPEGGVGAPTYQVTPAWGSGTYMCGKCHADGSSHMGDGTMASGSHTAHLLYPFQAASDSAKCTICHNLGGNSYTIGAGCASMSCHANGGVVTKHADHNVDVSIVTYFGGAYGGTPTPGDAYGSCTNVYCHSDGKATPTTYATPIWGNAASGACGSCHGANASAPPATAPHAKHVGSSYPYKYACAECHSQTVKHTANSTTFAAITSTVYHVNKAREIAFDPSNPYGNYSSAVQGCRSLYCHSTGKTSIAAGNLPGIYNSSVYARPNWSGATACNSCHGRSTSNGMPDYTNAGAPGSSTSNSHSSHVNSSNIACAECHEKTTKTNTTIRATSPSYHVAGTPSVFFNLTGNNSSGTYDSGQKKCSSTYCHGAAASVAWGGTNYCNSCHSANDGTSGGGGVNNWGTGVSAHTLHVEDTTTLPWKFTNYSTGNLSTNSALYRFGCASCHNPAQAGHANGYASGSYRAEVFFGFTTPGRKPTYTYTGTAGTSDNGFAWSNGNAVCNQTYCHSNGAGGNGAAVSWATTTNSATNTRCKTCHGYTTASGSAIATGDHGAHVNGATYNFSCRKCHAATTTDGSSLTDKTKHVNKAVNIAFNNTTTAVNGTYNGLASPMSKSPGSSYASCANTYCHSLGTSTTPSSPNVTPTWGSTLNATCSGCHGNDNSAAYQMGTVGSTAHSKHVQTYSYGCVKCHASTVSDNRSIATYGNHVDRMVNVAFNNSTSAVSGTYNGASTPMTKLPGSATGTCTNTYCHSTGKSTTPSSSPPNIVPNWTNNMDSTCSSCHGNDNSAGYKMGTVGSSTHTAHIQTYTNFTCDYCHAGTATNNRTIGTVANHVNRKVDVSFNSWVNASATYGGVTPNSKLPGSAMTNCANTYCHSNGTSVSSGSIPANTTVDWGTAGPLACNACHGNATYGSDFRKAAPLYASSSPKGNAHQLHIDQSAGGGAPAATDPQCLHCHAATTTTNTSITNTANHVDKGYDLTAGGTFANGDTVGQAAVAVSYSYTFNAGGSTCTNVSCHPTGLTGVKSTDVVPWSDKHTCDDCHKVNLNNNTGYHHAMRNYSGSGAAYPKAIPGITAGANDVNRRCTMCHVDHATFSPSLNASNTTYGSAGNLRMSILSSVTATKGYTNRDFIKTGSGGICVSCHNSELFKDTGGVRVKNETNSTKTMAIVLNNYTGSAHEYSVNSTMRRDSKVFNADCSKCHNGRRNEVAVFSDMTTATHDRDVRRIYANLGSSSLTDGIDALFCYRCHSHSGDAIGGTVKPADGKDYYNVASMSSAAEGIFTACNNVGVNAYPTTGSSILYLRNTGTINSVPPSPEPTGYQYSSGTYTTNTFTQRDMAPTSGSTTASTSISTGSTAGRYNRGLQFVSPQIDNTITIPSGSTFTLTIREARAFGTSTDYTRFTVYKWNGTTATPLNTTAAPNNYGENATAITTTATNRTTSFTTNSDVTLNPGDALICDVEFEHSAGTTALNVTYSYGNFGTDGAQLQLPAGTYNWRTGAATIKAGHNVGNAGYAGLHKPSTTDETQAYLTSNRHVSCNDCHNAHVATAANPLRGATGIDPTNSTAGAAPTAYSVVSVMNADLQYKVCFKCHTNWAGYGTGTTNLAVDFNTANDSFHWVERDKFTYAVNTGTGRGIWQNAQFNLNAVPTQGTKKYVEVMMPRAGITYDNATLRTLPLRCSDCHGSDGADGGVNIPEGPHGSAYANILKVPAGSPYTTWDATTSTLTGDCWCLNCHDPLFTNSGFKPSEGHLYGGSGKHQRPCQYCHIAIPHGSGSQGAGAANQRKHLLKPTTFTEGIDSETSGSQSQHGSWVIPGCT